MLVLKQEDRNLYRREGRNFQLEFELKTANPTQDRHLGGQTIFKTEEGSEELLTRRLSALVYNSILPRPTEDSGLKGEGGSG